LYYRLVPAAGTTSLAKVQRWLHVIGAILFPASVAVVLGSLIVVAAMGCSL